MENIAEALFIALFSAGGAALVVTLFVAYQILRNPEKIEIWASILYRLLSRFRGLFRTAHRSYVKHDLQGRINRFTKEVSKEAPYMEEMQISIKWVDVTVDQKTFLNNGKAVLRLSKHDPDDMNFVRGAYWAVSTRLLPKVKRYVSPTQRQALDLYVTAKVIMHEKHTVIEHFLDEFLHNQVDEEGKISKLYASFERIDRYGVFYPILLQELYFLSLKVYGGPKHDNVIQEVTRLVAFLEKVSSRATGEHIDLNYVGEFCKFGIVIIGTGAKMSLEGPSAYVGYVSRELMPKKVETIYLLGKLDYSDFIDEVCPYLAKDYDVYKTHSYTGHIWSADRTETIVVQQYLAVLRSRSVPLYQPGQRTYANSKHEVS